MSSYLSELILVTVRNAQKSGLHWRKQTDLTSGRHRNHPRVEEHSLRPIRLKTRPGVFPPGLKCRRPRTAPSNNRGGLRVSYFSRVGSLECLGILSTQRRLFFPRELFLFDGQEHIGCLFAAHNTDARIGHIHRKRGARRAPPFRSSRLRTIRQNYGQFGHGRIRDACTIFAPSLAIPPASYSWPTIKPEIFCRNSSGMPR